MPDSIQGTVDAHTHCNPWRVGKRPSHTFAHLRMAKDLKDCEGLLRPRISPRRHIGWTGALGPNSMRRLQRWPSWRRSTGHEAGLSTAAAGLAIRSAHVGLEPPAV